MGDGVRRARILVVDDEPAIGRSLGALLAQDHDVRVMTSGAEALAELLENATAYDVVLCDLMMPHVTGMDIHARLAEERPNELRKLVFMTGGAFTEPAIAFLERVDSPRLEKPFTLDTLKNILGERLG